MLAPPLPGQWRWTLGASGTTVHNEHAAMEGDVHLWHVQDITTTESAFTLARGLRPGLGAEVSAFVRHLTARIDFEDEQRRPLRWPQGDIHHRNETLVGAGDPWLLLHGARNAGGWTLSARAGATLPLGRTEPNPFERGRRGLPHQHVQFGTGTVDPLLGLGVGRRMGDTAVALTALGRFTVSTNRHGYRAGDRYQGALEATRRLGARWHAGAALMAVREQPETWWGRLEEEGNLGRTDALVSLALTRRAGAAALTAGVQVPVLTRATGAQLDYPAVVFV
ncbi:MAG TPA: hypothetical protein VFO85_20310, partial [Vicinamibacteria bacterium]|nr:hypothetical protein [Vicinamibacteria bacterium]